MTDTDIMNEINLSVFLAKKILLFVINAIMKFISVKLFSVHASTVLTQLFQEINPTKIIINILVNIEGILPFC